MQKGSIKLITFPNANKNKGIEQKIQKDKTIPKDKNKAPKIWDVHS